MRSCEVMGWWYGVIVRAQRDADTWLRDWLAARGLKPEEALCCSPLPHSEHERAFIALRDWEVQRVARAFAAFRASA